MPDKKGWPDPAKPGVPENPTQEGPHLIADDQPLPCRFEIALLGVAGVEHAIDYRRNDGTKQQSDAEAEHQRGHQSGQHHSEVVKRCGRHDTVGGEVRRGRMPRPPAVVHWLAQFVSIFAGQITGARRRGLAG